MSDASGEAAAPVTAPVQRKAWKWLLRLGLGLLVLALLLHQRQMGPLVLQGLRAVPLPVLAGAVLFYWVGQVLSAYKWQLLLRARGAEAGLGLCCRLYLAGMFGNLWLPTNIGGDGLRAFLLTRHLPTLRLTDAAASIFVERITGFGALLLIALVGLLLGGAAAGPGLRLVGLGLLVLLALGGLWALAGRAGGKANSALGRKLAGVTGAIGFYLEPQRRPALALSLVLSILFQGSQVLLNIYLATAAGLQLPAGTYWWLCPLLSLSGLLPVGIGGLGVREAAAVGLLAQSGLHAPEATIVTWSLLWQVTVWLSSLPGGLFLRGEKQN